MLVIEVIIIGDMSKKKKVYKLKPLTVQPLSVTLLGMLFRHHMTFGASETGIVRFVHELFNFPLLNSAACLIFISHFSVYMIIYIVSPLVS